ncbi:Clp protease [Streptomyces sp. AJS327]|uniref:Clp protease N-terminal domain-containing protein n=1 Tax=Streptomyces sp. AJS327 TaxID=2545265 RepID=UPI0015DE4D31|nr:Clp protease N-terminal domain-containing protein [Streptomyces sp. AJS327]MBA0049945.1 Clp protease [Streptomyces sp. AJS327]
MFERFASTTRHLVVVAQEEARALAHRRIGTEHLLLAALHDPEQPGAATLARIGVTRAACRTAVTEVADAESGALGEADAEALRGLGIDLEAVRAHADATFGPGALNGPAPARAPRGHLPFAPPAKRALRRALEEAKGRRDRHIGVEHVVLGVLGVLAAPRAEDPAGRAVLDRLGVVPADLRELVLADLRSAA